MDSYEDKNDSGYSLREIMEMMERGEDAAAAVALWKGAEAIRRKAVLDAHKIPSVCEALDSVVASAIGNGYSVPKSFEDGTISLLIGHNASHQWEVTYEWHGPEGHLAIVTSTDMDSGQERNRIVRKDEEMPTYVGHF